MFISHLLFLLQRERVLSIIQVNVLAFCSVIVLQPTCLVTNAWAIWRKKKDTIETFSQAKEVLEKGTCSKESVKPDRDFGSAKCSETLSC